MALAVFNDIVLKGGLMMKKRVFYLGLTLLTIILGLASRKFMFIFPQSIAPYIGDTLWAVMVYFGFRFLIPHSNVLKSFLLAIIFSYLIELSQLYQATWINQIRSTILGGLILGHGFLYEDLISYTLGISLGLGFDYLLQLLFNSELEN